MLATLLVLPLAAQQRIPGFDAGTKLTPPPISIGTTMGRDVDLSGDVLVAGPDFVPGTAQPSGPAQPVHVFQRSAAGDWDLVKTLLPLPPPGNVRYGQSVSVSGDTIAVGAPLLGAGAVYLYERDVGGPGNWGLRKRIDGPIVQTVGQAGGFGYSVALDGARLAVGAIGDSSDAQNYGAAYVFDRNRGGADNWGMLVQRMSGICGDGYGYKVALSNDVLLVDAPVWFIGFCTTQGFPVPEPNRVYAYVQKPGEPGVWPFLKMIVERFRDPIGRDLAISGDTIAVTAMAGIELYGRDVGGPNAFGKITDLAGSLISVDLDEDRLVSDIGFCSGANIAVHRRDAGGLDAWGRIATLIPPPSYTGPACASAEVAIDGEVVARGLPVDDQAGMDAGAVWVFEEEPAFPAQPLPRPAHGVRPP